MVEEFFSLYFTTVAAAEVDVDVVVVVIGKMAFACVKVRWTGRQAQAARQVSQFSEL